MRHFSIGVGQLKGIQGAGKFSPLFPATCPFVIAVGATQVNPNSTVYEPESACEQQTFSAYSGGGFSNIFPMPSYQEDVVRGYLKDNPPPYTAEQYNNSGRVNEFTLQYKPSYISLMHLLDPRISRFVCEWVNIILRPYHYSALLIRSYSANFVIVRNGNTSLAYGTSASVQVVGAIMTLINDARLANDKSTIGES